MKKEFFRHCYLNKEDQQFKKDLDKIYEIEIFSDGSIKESDEDSINTMVEQFAKFNAELSWNMFCLNSKDYFTDV